MRASSILLLALAAAPAMAVQPVRLDPPAVPGSMAVSLARSGDSVIASWLEPPASSTKPSDQGAIWTLRFSRLEKGAWMAPATITSGTDIFVNWADTPSLLDAGDGRLLARWAVQTGPLTFEIGLARSADSGRTWKRLPKSEEQKTPGENGFVSLLSDRGTLRAFWLDGRERKGDAGAQTLRTAAISDRPDGSERLDARVCDCCQTAAVLTAEGPAIVYRGRSRDEIRDIAIVRRVRSGWTKPALVAADGWHMTGCPVNGPAAAASGTAVAVAWFTMAQDRARVQVAFSSDSGATFGKPIVVDETAPLGRVAVALDGADAIVSWAATEGGSPSIRLRRVSPGGRLGPPLVAAPTTAARTGGQPRLERAGDNLVLAWLETSEPSRVRAAILPAASVR
jgi:hypothetical protein